MLEWVLVMTIEANLGKEVQQYAVPGFRTRAACMEAGNKLSMETAEALKRALSGTQESERTTGYPTCIEIDKG